MLLLRAILFAISLFPFGAFAQDVGGASGAPTGSASGDLSGTYPGPTVGKINGTACDAGFTLGPYGCTWTQTASNSASLDFTGLVGNNYKIQCTNLLPATNATTVLVLFGEGGTPTYQTSNYVNVGFYFLAASSGSVGGPITSGIEVADNISSSGAGLDFGMEFFGLASSVTHMTISVSAYINGSSVLAAEQFRGEYTGDTTPITALRIKALAGNLTSGTCALTRLS